MGDSTTSHLFPLINSSPANLETLLGVLDRASVPVAVAQGPELRLTSANRAYLTLSGVPPDADMPRSARDAFPSSITGDGGALLTEVLNGQEVRNLPSLAVNMPGQPTVFFDVECRPLLDADGNAEAVLIVAYAASEKLARQKIERAEAALREHTTRLNLALHAAEMGEWEYDVAEDVLIRSTLVDRMFGFEPGEAGAAFAPFLDRINEKDRPHVMAALSAAQENTGSIDLEYRVLWPNGAVRWLACRGEVLSATNGLANRLVGVIMDVTERKNAEEALREREARFRELADAMPQIVWSADAKGHADYFNRRSLEYTRSRDGSVWDRGWRESMHPDDVQPTIDRWRHSVETGETYEIEYRFKDPESGDYRWHLGRALPIRNEEGEIVRWLGTSTDIHDQKLAEQELAAALFEKEKLLELKTSLLREINHRVKNSLQLVSSLLNLQGRNINDPEVRFRFDEATRRVLTVARVHERLYETDNVDRMEFGQFLRDLCHDVAKSLAGQARRHLLKIDAPQYDVLVDQAIPLALVVNELVTNAFKYAFDDTQIGEIRVNLIVEDSQIRLEITDNGRGLPSGFDVGTSRGLGMILVNALTRQLKGGIRFAPGEPGARFVVTAPRIKDAEPGLRITSARVPSPSAALRA